MKTFEVSTKEEKGIVVLYMKGKLDAHTASDFEQELQKVADEKRYKLVINLSELEYISSAGLGVFMSFIELFRSNQGDIKLSEMSSKVFRVFDLLGFPTLFEIYKNESEAIEKFS